MLCDGITFYRKWQRTWKGNYIGKCVKIVFCYLNTGYLNENNRNTCGLTKYMSEMNENNRTVWKARRGNILAEGFYTLSGVI